MKKWPTSLAYGYKDATFGATGIAPRSDALCSERSVVFCKHGKVEKKFEARNSNF